MYSVLLTAMMTTGATTPDFGGNLFSGGCMGCFGCGGCSGCCGGCFGCSGCYGCGGCSGCCGGGGLLGLGLFSSNRSSCFGCSGCCGGCFGCFGGCSGCYGMAFGYCSGYSAPPISFGLPGPIPIMPSLGDTVAPGIPNTMPPTEPPGETLPPAPAPGTGESISSPNQATVVVELPADARLFADGQAIEQTGPVRTFRTPPLEPGKSYYYVISIEMTRNGKAVRNEERVSLEAGKVARVRFPEPAAAGGGNTASIDIRIPEGATLTVDGKTMSVSGGHAVVQTPELMTGRDHSYVLSVELSRHGQRHTMSREVRFQAGQRLTVEFEEPKQGRNPARQGGAGVRPEQLDPALGGEKPGRGM